MDFWIKAAQLLLSLSILVALHEFGHYIAARAFKIRVEKFYIFFDAFGISLLKKKINDTQWGIGWLPLGGYVKIAGMIDESMDTEQMKLPPKPDEFRSKPAWQRLIVMSGGVIVNIILGFIIYIAIVGVWGENILSNDTLKYGIAIDPHFKELNTGIEDGDIITKVEGKPVENANLVNFQIFLRKARVLEVQKANGDIKEIVLADDINKQMWQAGAPIPFEPRIPIVVDTVFQDRDVYQKGLRKGDSIVSLNGEETVFFNDFISSIAQLEDSLAAITIGFYRGGEKMEIETMTGEDGKVGIVPQQPDWLVPTKLEYGFTASIEKGFEKAKWTLSDYLAQLPLIFTKEGAKSVGGFGTIGSLFPSTWDWQVFWTMTAFISMVLAIMNLLPIPALDGGHIVFLIYEMITGRPAPQKVLEVAQIIGIIIVFALLIYANGNDIYRLLIKN